MSNDRELLELTARAAGYAVEWKEWRTSRIAEFGAIKYTKHVGFWVEGKQWNPLTDDADAFRLAMALRLDIFHNVPDADLELGVRVAGSSMRTSDYVPAETERNAVARRLIVKIAARLAP